MTKSEIIERIAEIAGARAVSVALDALIAEMNAEQVCECTELLNAAGYTVSSERIEADDDAI